MVRGSVEEMLNELLEAEIEKLIQVARYERNEQRQVLQRTLQSELHHNFRRCNAQGTQTQGHLL